MTQLAQPLVLGEVVDQLDDGRHVSGVIGLIRGSGMPQPGVRGDVRDRGVVILGLEALVRRWLICGGRNGTTLACSMQGASW